MNTRYNSFKADIVANTLPVVKNDTISSGLNVPIKYFDFTTRLFLQSTIKDRWAFRVGLEHKYLNVYTDEVINDETNRIHFEKSHFLNAFGKVMLDTYDTKYFPKKGFYIDTEYLLYGVSSNYNNNFSTFSQLYGRLGIPYTFFNKLTLHLDFGGGCNLGE